MVSTSNTLSFRFPIVSNLLTSLFQTDKQDTRNDKLSKIIEDIRAVMNLEDTTQLKSGEIWKKLVKRDSVRYGKEITKDNLMEALNHYKKLSIIWIDNEENVILL